MSRKFGAPQRIMHTTIVVDDHPFVRSTVKALLSLDGFEIVGEASNGQNAITLVHELLPDLMVLDLGLPDLDGLEVMHRLEKVNKTKILVLSAESPELFATRCKLAGAAGYVHKNLELSVLSKAAQAIMNGDTYFPDTAFCSVCKDNVQLNESQRLASLSDREMMVFQQLARGMSNKQIADAALISNKTVSTYKTRLLQKLDLKSVVDLAYYAQRNR